MLCDVLTAWQRALSKILK